MTAKLSFDIFVKETKHVIDFSKGECAGHVKHLAEEFCFAKSDDDSDTGLDLNLRLHLFTCIKI